MCCVGCTWGAGLGSGGGLLSMAGHHWTLQWRGCISREEDGGVLRPESVLSGEMNEGAEVKLYAVRVDRAHIKLHIHTDRQYSNNATFSRQDPSVWYQLSTQVLHKSPANIFFWHRTKSFSQLPLNDCFTVSFYRCDILTSWNISCCSLMLRLNQLPHIVIHVYVSSGQFESPETIRCLHRTLLFQILRHPRDLPRGHLPVPAGLCVSLGDFSHTQDSCIICTWT